jgi:hypothetical protein
MHYIVRMFKRYFTEKVMIKDQKESVEKLKLEYPQFYSEDFVSRVAQSASYISDMVEPIYKLQNSIALRFD